MSSAPPALTFVGRDAKLTLGSVVDGVNLAGQIRLLASQCAEAGSEEVLCSELERKHAVLCERACRTHTCAHRLRSMRFARQGRGPEEHLSGGRPDAYIGATGIASRRQRRGDRQGGRGQGDTFKALGVQLWRHLWRGMRSRPPRFRWALSLALGALGFPLACLIVVHPLPSIQGRTAARSPSPSAPSASCSQAS